MPFHVPDTPLGATGRFLVAALWLGLVCGMVFGTPQEQAACFLVAAPILLASAIVAYRNKGGGG